MCSTQTPRRRCERIRGGAIVSLRLEELCVSMVVVGEQGSLAPTLFLGERGAQSSAGFCCTPKFY